MLRALEPLLAIEPRAGVDEPGFWPWPDLYADALVSVGKLDEAEELLDPARGAGGGARARGHDRPAGAGCAGGWRRPAGSCRTPRRPSSAR